MRQTWLVAQVTRQGAMTIRESLKMQVRSEFKQIILSNHLSVKGIERLEASFDALKASDYAKIPMYYQDIDAVENLLKGFYGEGPVN